MVRATKQAGGRDHILVQQSDLSVVCTFCHERMRLALPVNVDVWVAAATKFAELHEACELPNLRPLTESDLIARDQWGYREGGRW